MSTASEAIERLRQGNGRFVAGQSQHYQSLGAAERNQLADGQAPFAVMLGCSDSRVPLEHVFDQGLGDLFAIRVAGNIAEASQIGSIEFAVDRFVCALVVVLGHSRCGAIDATIQVLQARAKETKKAPVSAGSPSLQVIVDRITPANEPLIEEQALAAHTDFFGRCVRANVIATVNQLRQAEPILKRQVESGALLIVGAEYNLETGLVEFVDELDVPNS